MTSILNPAEKGLELLGLATSIDNRSTEAEDNRFFFWLDLKKMLVPNVPIYENRVKELGLSKFPTPRKPECVIVANRPKRFVPRPGSVKLSGLVVCLCALMSR